MLWLIYNVKEMSSKFGVCFKTFDCEHSKALCNLKNCPHVFYSERSAENVFNKCCRVQLGHAR